MNVKNITSGKRLSSEFTPPKGPPLVRSPEIQNFSNWFTTSEAEREVVKLFKKTMLHDINTSLPNSKSSSPEPTPRNIPFKKA